MQRQGYNRTAVILHWILAVSIFFLFASSWWMLGLPLPSKELTFREFPFQLHKNIGITLVFLLALLLYVRFKHRPAPENSSSMKPWMHKLALFDHVILYVLYNCRLCERLFVIFLYALGYDRLVAGGSAQNSGPRRRHEYVLLEYSPMDCLGVAGGGCCSCNRCRLSCLP